MSDRRSLGLWLRTLASLLMLAILVPRIDVADVFPRWDRAVVLWLGAALLTTAAAVLTAALRWRAVLAGLDLHRPLRSLLQHYLAGLFVGNFLPSTIGGDVLRVRRLAVETKAGADAFASVVLERLTGMFVLPLLTLSALAVNPGLRELGTASSVAAGFSVVTVLLLGLVLWLVSHPRVGARFIDGGSWRRFAGAVHLGSHRFRRHPQAIVGVLAAAFAYQLLMVLAAFFAARALDLHHVGLTAVLAFVPAVAVVQVVPISLGGLGIREGALALFLHPLDVPTGRAVALGLLIYGMNLTVSLLGAPSFAMGSRERVEA